MYPDLSSVKRILVVKLRHHGDVLLTSPLFSNLKRALPNAQIDAYIYADTLPMLEGHPAISKFFLCDRRSKKISLFKRLKKDISSLLAMRRQGYDLVLNMTEGDRGALIALFSGARFRVGYDPEKKGFLGKRSIYTHIVKNCKTPRHTVEKHLDVLRRIGIFPTLGERDLSLHIPETARLSLTQKLEGIREYVVIHPTSRWLFKCAPPETIAQVIKELDKRGKKVVLSAGPDAKELHMIEKIIALSSPISVLNLGGKLDLKELAALIAMSKALLCVDSVPLHIASALKVPVVALFGPSLDQNWGPWMHPKGHVVALKNSCRPCHMDGCGGSKMSDCLYQLPISSILAVLDNIECRK